MKKEIEVKRFDKDDYRLVDKFTKYIYGLGTSVLIFIILAIIVLLVLSFLLIYNLFKGGSPKIEKHLKDIYPDLSFSIEQLRIDNDGYGLYKGICLEDRDVNFYIYKDSKTNNVFDDFSQRYRKYYLENFQDEKIKKELIIEEKITKYGEYEFINDYEFWMEVSNYSEIEETTKKLFILYQHFRKSAKLPSFLLIGGLIRQKDKNYISDGAFEYEMTLDELIQREENTYKDKIGISSLQ